MSTTPSTESTRARLLIFVVRHPDLTYEEFSKKWIELGKVLKSLEVFTNNIRRMDQFHVDQPMLESLKKMPGLNVPEIDGIALFEADTVEKLLAPFGTEDFKTKVSPLEPSIFALSKLRVYPSTFSTPLDLVPSSPAHPSGAAVTVPECTPRQDRVMFAAWTRKNAEHTKEDFISWWKGPFIDAFIGYPKTKEVLLSYEQNYLCDPIAQILASRGRKIYDECAGVAFFESKTFEGPFQLFGSEDFMKNVSEKEKKWVDTVNTPVLGFRQVRMWEY